MNPIPSPREALLQRIIEFGTHCPEVRALALVGSSARTDHPADEWSDIDVILVTPAPERFLQSSTWLHSIAEPWVVTVERDDAGRVVEQRALFDSGVDADFIVLASDHIDALKQEPLCSIIRRGARALVDKDGLFPAFNPNDRAAAPFRPPTQAEFSELVNDFWFHTVWTAKKIKRGEYWTAKSCCDIYMKRLLLKMIEWLTGVEKGWDQTTWYNGRFIEQWAPAWIVERLPSIYAHYNEADLWRALEQTMRLFDDVAPEAARQLKVSYPETEVSRVHAWMSRLTAPSFDDRQIN